MGCNVNGSACMHFNTRDKESCSLTEFMYMFKWQDSPQQPYKPSLIDDCRCKMQKNMNSRCDKKLEKFISQQLMVRLGLGSKL